MEPIKPNSICILKIEKKFFFLVMQLQLDEWLQLEQW